MTQDCHWPNAPSLANFWPVLDLWSSESSDFSLKKLLQGSFSGLTGSLRHTPVWLHSPGKPSLSADASSVGLRISLLSVYRTGERRSFEGMNARNIKELLFSARQALFILHIQLPRELLPQMTLACCGK